MKRPHAALVACPPCASVQVRGMVKHFNTPRGVFKAVDGVNVDVEASGIIALLGPSGSGKTTLLRLIAGLESPTAGRIMFDDEDATALSVQDRQIGFVFQSYALFNHKTVAENIKFGLEVRPSPLNPPPAPIAGHPVVSNCMSRAWQDELASVAVALATAVATHAHGWHAYRCNPYIHPTACVLSNHLLISSWPLSTSW
jgi:ABC-type sugar transport system ATPase subunit